MSVVSIARELGALGEETAKAYAALTGYRLLDREYLERKLSEHGIGPDEREKYDERKPGFWSALSQERDDYLHYLKTILYEEGAAGNFVVLGRGGTAVFAGVPGALSVRVVAPHHLRVERVAKHYQCDERRAEQIIKRSDGDREGFHRFFFNTDWRDAVNYDLVLNTAVETPEAVAKAIEATRQVFSTPERERECAARLKELALGQRIVTEVLYAKRVPIHFLEASVSKGLVTLHGVANTQGAIDAALAAARLVPGAEKVESAIQVVQDFTVMP